LLEAQPRRFDAARQLDGVFDQCDPAMFVQRGRARGPPSGGAGHRGSRPLATFIHQLFILPAPKESSFPSLMAPVPLGSIMPALTRFGPYHITPVIQHLTY